MCIISAAAETAEETGLLHITAGSGTFIERLRSIIWRAAVQIRSREEGMYYSTIKDCDIANGPGVRISIFVSGCTNHCKNCFQPQTWDFEYGEPFTADTEAHIIELMKPDYIQGLTLLGGEPMEPQNQRALLPFIKHVRAAYPGKDIWCFTGFTLEMLKTEGSHPRCEVTDEFLAQLDVLVDGRFVEELKSPALRFRGSSNQRLIDMKRTLAEGTAVLMPDLDRKLNGLPESR